MERQECSVALRRKTQEDLAFLYGLFCEEKRSEFEMAGLDEKGLDTLLRSQFAIRSAQFESQCAPDGNLIVEYKGQPKGHLLFALEGDCLRIVDVALSPDIRRRGLGTALLRYLQNQVLASPTTDKIVLHVVETNPARRLYERLGFATVSQQSPYLRMEWHCEAQENCVKHG